MSQRSKQTSTEDLALLLRDIPSYLLTRISHRHNMNMREALKGVGLTTTPARVLVSLAIFKELSVSDLCVYAVAEQSTMSRALDKMEADGLIQRQAGLEDSRMRLIQLTDLGKACYHKVWPIMSEHNESMMRGISEADRQQMLKTLGRMLENTRKNPI